MIDATVRKSTATLVFYRGNGRETRQCTTVDEAISEALAVHEYGNGWGMSIERDGVEVLGKAELLKAISELD